MSAFFLYHGYLLIPLSWEIIRFEIFFKLAARSIFPRRVSESVSVEKRALIGWTTWAEIGAQQKVLTQNSFTRWKIQSEHERKILMLKRHERPLYRTKGANFDPGKVFFNLKFWLLQIFRTVAIKMICVIQKIIWGSTVFFVILWELVSHDWKMK